MTKNNIIFDLWHNITIIHYNGFVVKQVFINKDIIKYEDSIGNYWDISMGINNPYPLYKTHTVTMNSDFFVEYIEYDEINLIRSRCEVGLIYVPYIPLTVRPDGYIVGVDAAVKSSSYATITINSRYGITTLT